MQSHEIDIPPIVTSVIEGQTFPPPPLSPRELLGYQLSIEENIGQFSEPDATYPNLVFNEKAYRKLLKSNQISERRLTRMGLTYKPRNRHRATSVLDEL